MNKTRTLVFASTVAGAMLFGGVVGATVLAHSPLSNVNAATPAAAASPSPKSNEAAAHETGETAAQETAENNGTAHHGGGPSNESAAHEATESPAREAAETPGTPGA